MKYVNPSTNEELHFGDIITKTTTKFTYDGLGKEITSVSFLFNADSKDKLISLGLVKEVEDSKRKEVKPVVLSNVIDYYGSKYGWSADKTLGFFTKLYQGCSAAALSAILKGAAVLLDRNYDGHICNCPTIYTVSFATWKISKIDVEKFKSEGLSFDWKNFSAFRTEQDAKIAVIIVQYFLSLVVNEQKD